jgi:MipA family protein
MNTCRNLLLSLSFFAFFAHAEIACDPRLDDCIALGEWQFSLGVGAGARTNPVINSATIPLLLLPQVSYTGEHFFLQNLDFGWMFFENEQHQFNALVTPSFDQVFFQPSDLGNYFFNGRNSLVSSTDRNDGNTALGPENQNGQTLHKRRAAGLVGVEYSGALANLDLQLQFLRDFTQVHHGDEARVLLTQHWQKNRHQIKTFVGANWQSHDVLHYYYGITAAEAPSSQTYSAASGVTTLAGIDWKYRLTNAWDLQCVFNYRQLPRAITASPLIAEHRVITAFVGGVYHF